MVQSRRELARQDAWAYSADRERPSLRLGLAYAQHSDLARDARARRRGVEGYGGDDHCDRRDDQEPDEQQWRGRNPLASTAPMQGLVCRRVIWVGDALVSEDK